MRRIISTIEDISAARVPLDAERQARAEEYVAGFIARDVIQSTDVDTAAIDLIRKLSLDYPDIPHGVWNKIHIRFQELLADDQLGEELFAALEDLQVTSNSPAPEGD